MAAEDTAAIDAFIDRWQRSGGAERANYQMFLSELTVLLGVPLPAPAQESNRHNDYVFERSVAFKHPDGSQTTGFIDLYKRDCFVLEAKQSAKPGAAKPAAGQLDFLPEDATQVKSGTAKRALRGWDTALLAARRQAEAMPGPCRRNMAGRPSSSSSMSAIASSSMRISSVRENYAQFPDRRGYRIMLDDLRDKGCARAPAPRLDRSDVARPGAQIRRGHARYCRASGEGRPHGGKAAMRRARSPSS